MVGERRAGEHRGVEHRGVEHRGVGHLGVEHRGEELVRLQPCANPANFTARWGNEGSSSKRCVWRAHELDIGGTV